MPPDTACGHPDHAAACVALDAVPAPAPAVTALPALRSRFRGLCFDKRHHAWRVRIFFQGKQRHVGRFRDDVVAARAYDKAAHFLYGPKAILNFPLNEVLADSLEVPAFIRLAKQQALQEGGSGGASIGGAAGSLCSSSTGAPSRRSGTGSRSHSSSRGCCGGGGGAPRPAHGACAMDGSGARQPAGPLGWGCSFHHKAAMQQDHHHHHQQQQQQQQQFLIQALPPSLAVAAVQRVAAPRLTPVPLAGGAAFSTSSDTVTCSGAGAGAIAGSSSSSTGAAGSSSQWCGMPSYGPSSCTTASAGRAAPQSQPSAVERELVGRVQHTQPGQLQGCRSGAWHGEHVQQPVPQQQQQQQQEEEHLQQGTCVEVLSAPQLQLGGLLLPHGGTMWSQEVLRSCQQLQQPLSGRPACTQAALGVLSATSASAPGSAAAISNSTAAGFQPHAALHSLLAAAPHTSHNVLGHQLEPLVVCVPHQALDVQQYQLQRPVAAAGVAAAGSRCAQDMPLLVDLFGGCGL